jgi:hypothetical protein
MEPGNALKGDRIFAMARRIPKTYQIKEIVSGKMKFYKSTKLIQSAYCIIEVPMITTQQ